MNRPTTVKPLTNGDRLNVHDAMEAMTDAHVKLLDIIEQLSAADAEALVLNGRSYVLDVLPVLIDRAALLDEREVEVALLDRYVDELQNEADHWYAVKLNLLSY